MANGLRILRERANLTQDQAAEAFGLSRSGYIKIEHGERPLRDDYIKAAMAVFGATEDDVKDEEVAKVAKAREKLSRDLLEKEEAARRAGMAAFLATLSDGEAALDWLELVADLEEAFRQQPGASESPDMERIRVQAETLAGQAKRKLQKYKEKKP